MKQLPAPAPRTKYARKNNFIQPGLVDELLATLACITCSEAILLAEQLGASHQTLTTKNGHEVTVEDIECIEGGNKMCGQTDGYYFLAGPQLLEDTSQKHDKDAFITIRGPLLWWLVDCVLFRISFDGMDVLNEIGIPL